MNKSQIISKISEVTGKTKKDTETFVEAFISTTTDALVAGEKVQLTGFLLLEPVVRAERAGHDIKSGKSITIPEHKAIKVKIGSELKKRVAE